jgi:hypothetical protein
VLADIWPGENCILERLIFPKELGHVRGTPLVFFDTNVILDAEPYVNEVFGFDAGMVRGVICDFIEGELVNLKKETTSMERLKKLPNSNGLYFETKYNSREGASKALADMPTGEMAEAVLIEYDKKLNPSGMLGNSKEAKSAARSKSKFVDFALLTVATVSALKRKKQSIVVSRDRWIKLSCKALEKQFKLPIYCYDQFSFSLQEIIDRTPKL